MNDSRLQLKLLQAQNNHDIALELLRNPFFGVLATFVIVEGLQKMGYIGSVAGTVIEGAVTGGEMLSAAAKSGAITALIEGFKTTKEATGGITQLLPLLAAVK